MYLAVLQHYDVRMASLQDLRKRLKPGGVYRRSELTHRAKSIDRHLNQLVKEGALQRVSRGLYYYPRTSVFGVIPPDESALVEGFLNSKSFLVTSPNAYNGLGVGTTQLYNKKIIYNRRRNGEFKLGNRTFEFRKRLYFPKSLTPEFLLVDLVNNLNTLAEDHDVVLKYVAKKVYGMDKEVIRRSVGKYGTISTKEFFSQFP